jgi:malonate-semialdehyde dehydrogenase (acetylating)/methylmalonate-semialdehyde dehydrogenase
LYSNGEFYDSAATEFFDVRDPSTQRLLSRVPQPTPKEMTDIVNIAEEAVEDWRNVSVLTRQRILFK